MITVSSRSRSLARLVCSSSSYFYFSCFLFLLVIPFYSCAISLCVCFVCVHVRRFPRLYVSICVLPATHQANRVIHIIAEYVRLLGKQKKLLHKISSQKVKENFTIFWFSFSWIFLLKAFLLLFPPYRKFSINRNFVVADARHTRLLGARIHPLACDRKHLYPKYLTIPAHTYAQLQFTHLVTLHA